MDFTKEKPHKPWRHPLPFLISLVLVWFLALTTRRHSSALHAHIQHHVSQLPTVKISFPSHPVSRYNNTKIALLIEPRPLPHLTPLLLHMLYVVPPDWQILYLGSIESLAQVNRSLAVQHYQVDGKLALREAPQNASYSAKEQRNRLLTDANFYKQYLPSAEWMLTFHANTILCANSPKDLNDWLQYDWVGAPWFPHSNRWSGGGALSLRHLPHIHRVLAFQTRQDDAESEDRWLIDRVKVLPGIRLPKPEIEKGFSVEGVWDERPMGIHVAGEEGGLIKEVWGDEARRKGLLGWCPEVKIVMGMKLERERCAVEEEKGEGKGQEEMEKEIQAQMAKDVVGFEGG
ncbi:MAG: hypothetical protein Q9220_006402 [cf. Caloplaca sp. 1 TL-2023]